MSAAALLAAPLAPRPVAPACPDPPAAVLLAPAPAPDPDPAPDRPDLEAGAFIRSLA